MKVRKNLLARIWAKLRGKPQVPPPVVLRSAQKRTVRGLAIEPLEGRIAPASLVSGSTITYTDLDGDLVTIKFSRALFNPNDVGVDVDLALVFDFVDMNGAASEFGDLTGQQLQKINFTLAPSVGDRNLARGISMTISAVEAGGGDGRTNVGQIESSNVPLGVVTIDGDLGQIDCGNDDVAVGLKALNVYSLGAISSSQGNNASYESSITGALGALKITTDLHEAYVHVQDGFSFGTLVARGSIGSVTIGGSLEGRATIGSGSDKTGFIEADRNIGAVHIGTLATDGIKGGGGSKSGAIEAGGSIGNVTLSGALHGAEGVSSGTIVSGGQIGIVKMGIATDGSDSMLIGDDGEKSGSIIAVGTIRGLIVHGDVSGADGFNSGIASAGGGISMVNISGSLLGGAGAKSGSLQATGSMGTVKVGDLISGGTGKTSGSIVAGAGIAGVHLGDFDLGVFTHHLSGGAGVDSGIISSGGSIGSIRIAGNIVAGTEENTGAISAIGSIRSVTIAGDLIGGADDRTGFIESGLNLGTVKIQGDLIGSSGAMSGSIFSGAKLSNILVEGKLSGSAGIGSGSIFSSTNPFTSDVLGAVRVLGSLDGGAGASSGMISAGGRINSVSVGTLGALTPVMNGGDGTYSGSVYAERSIDVCKIFGDVQGGGTISGVGTHSGTIEASEAIRVLNISGALKGGLGVQSGAVRVYDFQSGTTLESGNLGTTIISGGIEGGAGDLSGAIEVDGSMGSVSLGSISGGVGVESGAIRAGLSFTFGGAIRNLSVIEGITGGTGLDAGIVEAHGNIGSIRVGADVADTTIRAGDAIGKISIEGALSDSVISARGQHLQGRSSDLALGSFTAESVLNSLIRTGYDLSGAGINADAQIGTVHVIGDWTASSLIAGVKDGGTNGVGESDDAILVGTDNAHIISRIASVTIGGTVFGTDALVSATDHFGFVAQQIGAFKSGAGSLSLSASVGAQSYDLSDDVTVREQAVPV